MTGNQKKDLREAWNHLHEASEHLNKCQFNMGETNAEHVGQAQKEMSDARRLIDRVEQDRMP